MKKDRFETGFLVLVPDPAPGLDECMKLLLYSTAAGQLLQRLRTNRAIERLHTYIATYYSSVF